MANLKDIDRAIAVIKFNMRQMQDEINEIRGRVDLTEAQLVRIGRVTDLAKNVEFLIKAYKEDVDKSFGRTPVKAVELEEAVVGAVMLESNNYDVFNRLVKFLKPDHFYSIITRNVWKAIVSLNERNEPFDMISVLGEVRRQKTLAEIGGAFAIAGLTINVASAANIEYHAKIIVEMAAKRKITQIGARMISGGYSEDQDVFELMDFIDEQTGDVRSWLRK